MTLADYVRVARVRASTWAAFLVIGVLLAAVYSSLATVTYTATATSFVSVATDPESPENFQNSQFAVQRVKSYAPLTSSPFVLEPVIDELGLDLSPAVLRGMITVESPPETVLMRVHVTDTNAHRSALIANRVSAALASWVEELETAAGADEPGVKVTLAEPAGVPASPSTPRTAVNLLLGVVAGAAVGFVAALVRHGLDRRVRTVHDVRALLGQLPLGATERSPAASPRSLVDRDRGGAGAAEQYRTIRSALTLMHADDPPRHFVVTSPADRDGKTTLAGNLATSWAQSGARVCLVEADLRRRGTTLAGMSSAAGLADVLVGDQEVDDVLVGWGDGLLTLLPSGGNPVDPVALLGSPAMRTLVAALRERFDVVIYDGASLEVTDALVLGRAVDGVLLVARAGVTTRDALVTAVEELRRSGVRVIGTVLTAVTRMAPAPAEAR